MTKKLHVRRAHTHAALQTLCVDTEPALGLLWMLNSDTEPLWLDVKRDDGQTRQEEGLQVGGIFFYLS